jgi:hypothetical protein
MTRDPTSVLHSSQNARRGNFVNGLQRRRCGSDADPWFLSLTPAERLQFLQNRINAIVRIRELNARG